MEDQGSKHQILQGQARDSVCKAFDYFNWEDEKCGPVHGVVKSQEDAADEYGARIRMVKFKRKILQHCNAVSSHLVQQTLTHRHIWIFWK